MILDAKLVDRATGVVIADSLEVADGFWSRLVGLQFRKALPRGRAMLLTPCSSIHTFFLRFPIDVIFLDRQGQVLMVHRGVRPWRALWPVRHAHAVLELDASGAGLGEIDCIGKGNALTLLANAGSPVPASLNFLCSE